ncbi:phospholipase D-like domain-containing protein [Brachybacterium paraconglomeratum]|uniref:phospholipase D-like domain-containing protein n=1 Tax=Brachybacterium paraconglomeratum TaxID=173362 RepID=UPI0031ED4E70
MSAQGPLITSAANWLREALVQVDGDVVLTSPFLSYDVCRQVASAAEGSSRSWRLMTTLDPSAVANGYLSVQGMRALHQAGVEIRHVDRLHAKCFVVGTRAMLGSANLTGAGLGSSASPNRELGVELDLEQFHEALESITAWPSRIVSSEDLVQLEKDAQGLTSASSQSQAAPPDARSALQLAETLLADARDDDRTLWLKLEYGAPKRDGWREPSFFASPKKGRPGFRPGDLVFICAKESSDCYAVIEVTSEPEFQPEDYAAAVAVDRPGDLDRWPWVNRTAPRLVPDDLRELKLHELGVQGRALQNGHVRLRFDQFTAGVRALARLTSRP